MFKDAWRIAGMINALIVFIVGVIRQTVASNAPTSAEYGAANKTTSIRKDTVIVLASTHLPLLKKKNEAVGMCELEAA